MSKFSLERRPVSDFTKASDLRRDILQADRFAVSSSPHDFWEKFRGDPPFFEAQIRADRIRQSGQLPNTLHTQAAPPDRYRVVMAVKTYNPNDLCEKLEHKLKARIHPPLLADYYDLTIRYSGPMQGGKPQSSDRLFFGLSYADATPLEPCFSVSVLYEGGDSFDIQYMDLNKMYTTALFRPDLMLTYNPLFRQELVLFNSVSHVVDQGENILFCWQNEMNQARRLMIPKNLQPKSLEPPFVQSLFNQ